MGGAPALAERPRQRAPRRPALAARPRRTHAGAGGYGTRGALVFLLVVLGLIGSAGYLALQSVYFIGTNSRGLVTLYEGLPYKLPGNLTLYSSQLRLRRQRLDAHARKTAHAARSLAALGSGRRIADPQPRTGTARMRRSL